MKEKKNRKFGLWLESEAAEIIKKLSNQSRLPRGEIIRLCIDRELENPDYLKTLMWKKKSLLFNMNLVDSQIKKLDAISRQTGLSLGEIVRLCLSRQLVQIRREGGIKLKLDPDEK